MNLHGSTQGNAWFPLTGIRVPRLLTLPEPRSLVEPCNEPCDGSMYYREATCLANSFEMQSPHREKGIDVGNISVGDANSKAEGLSEIRRTGATLYGIAPCLAQKNSCIVLLKRSVTLVHTSQVRVDF